VLKRRLRLENINVKYVALISTLTTLIFIYLALRFKVFRIYPIVSPTLPIPVSINFYNVVVASIVLLIMPPALVLYRRHLLWDRVENVMPMFLRDLSELSKVGVPIPQAILELSKKPYGFWSKDLKKLAIRISLGEDFEEAVRAIAKKYPISVQRYLEIIVEAFKSGGRASEVLDLASRFTSSIRSFEEEKKRSLKVYMLVLYISILIYLASSAAIIYMSVKLHETSAGAGEIIKGIASPSALLAILYSVGIFEALFAGAVIGKLLYRSVSYGIMHILIILFIVMVSFNIINSYLILSTEPIPLPRL